MHYVLTERSQEMPLKVRMILKRLMKSAPKEKSSP